jgi:hypothetical protein
MLSYHEIKIEILRRVFAGSLDADQGERLVYLAAESGDVSGGNDSEAEDADKSPALIRAYVDSLEAR